MLSLKLTTRNNQIKNVARILPYASCVCRTCEVEQQVIVVAIEVEQEVNNVCSSCCYTSVTACNLIRTLPSGTRLNTKITLLVARIVL